MIEFNYLGFDKDYLDSVECYLTYKGANAFLACESGLTCWIRRFGLDKKFTVDELFDCFEMYYPEPFVDRAVRNLLRYLRNNRPRIFKKLVSDHQFMDSDECLSHYTDKRILKRYLKATIILAIQISLPKQRSFY